MEGVSSLSSKRTLLADAGVATRIVTRSASASARAATRIAGVGLGVDAASRARKWR